MIKKEKKLLDIRGQRVTARPSIGFSNGWLNAKLTKSLSQQSKIMHLGRAETCEMVCDEIIGLNMKSKFRDLQSNSIHLPSFSKFKNSSKGKLLSVGKSLEHVFSYHGADRATIHADVVSFELISWLKQFNVPVAIENMDRNKESGKLPLEIIRQCNENKVPLVLDLQHAFEISVDLYGEGFESEVAIQLAKLAKKSCGISQIHLSGEICFKDVVINNHALLMQSTNRRQILDSLVAVRSILGGNLPPIILEGDYLPLVSLGQKEGKLFETYANMAVVNMNIEKNLLLSELGFSQEDEFDNLKLSSKVI
jgi:hypothetical protein